MLSALRSARNVETQHKCYCKKYISMMILLTLVNNQFSLLILTLRTYIALFVQLNNVEDALI